MSKYEDQLENELLEEALLNQPLPIMIAHVVVAKNSGEHIGDGTEGHVIAFTKQQDAVYAAEHLNKEMIKRGVNHRTYSVEYIHIFDKQYYN
jgi:hypothetical protein